MKKTLMSILCFLALCTAKAQTSTIPRLATEQKAILAVAALTAQGNLSQLRNEFDVALEAGLTINQIKEVIVHTYAYAGFPRSIRGLQTFMLALEERKARGIKDNLGAGASPIQDTDSKYSRGKAILDTLLGAPQSTTLSGYSAFAPVIETFLKEHLFADIFERDVLTYAERELTTIAVLSSIEGVEPMLKSHLSICLNLGLSPEQLQDCVVVLKPIIGEQQANSMQQVLHEVLATY